VSRLSGDSQRAAWQAISRASIIDAESARAVRHYLEQTACHHQVFYEVKCLVGIGKVSMKEDRRGQAEERKYDGNDTCPIAHDKEATTADFDRDSSQISKGRGQRECGGLDQCDRGVVAHDFAYSAHHEWQADE
jgi:hypothetical protein